MNKEETDEIEEDSDAILPDPAVHSEPYEQAIVPADPLQAYIGRVKEYRALSREEEMELARRYHETGDKELAFQLVTANLMLVVKLAFEFRTQFQNMLDLIQEGNYGLLRAVKKFDPFKGARLSTYATYWIKAYMLKYLLDNWRLVRVGTTNVRRKLLYNLKDIEQKLAIEGQEPDTKLLAAHFGATEKDVIEVQKSIGAVDTSIHQPVSEGSSREVGDTLASPGEDFAETTAENQLKERFNLAIEKFRKDLKPSDLVILDKRILSEDPMTLQEIGEENGVTREAVRQAEVRLTKRLTDFVKEELGDE